MHLLQLVTTAQLKVSWTLPANKNNIACQSADFRLGVQLGMYGAAAGPQVNTAQLDQTSPPPPPLEQHWQQSEPRHCCRNKAEAMRGDIP
jgi:hypothetical protein